MNDSSKDWWEQQHQQQSGHLSGNPLRNAVDFLHLRRFLKPGATVLCIGVGTGGWMEEMYRLGIHMYGLDISDISLARVKRQCIQTYNETNMKDLPADTFDLAVSYYVAQHMTNENLEEQFRYVLPSLKPDGILAIQFMAPVQFGEEPKWNQEIGTPPGRVLRSLLQMNELAFRGGGIIDRVVSDSPLPTKDLREMGVHIKRSCL